MADTSIKLSGTYDSIEAYNILEEMREMSTDYEEIKEEAEAAASAATAAVTTAQTAANNASTYADNAQTYAGNANTSAGEAAEYASNASTSATNAATSETNASNSASAAATSEANAAISETNAGNSATAASGSASAAAASAAEVEAALDDYLPLAGGTMTGAIKGNPITLTADDGNGNIKSFVANADGTLTWGGNNVITRQMFLTRTVSGSAVTVNGGSSAAEIIVDLTFAGYTPLGVVGFWFTGASVTYFNIMRVEFVDGNKVSFAGRNFNANAITITPYAQALYIKNQ